MTSRNGDPPTDVTVDVPAERMLSRALEPATFEQFQSELDDFVRHTRFRLNSLSQSLTKCLSSGPEIHTETGSSVSVKASGDESIDAIGDQDLKDSADALMTETQPPATAIVSSSFVQSREKIASTDLFSAIKLRLAQQLKNSS